MAVQRDAAHSAGQVTRAFMVRSLLTNFECLGCSPLWIFGPWSMCGRFSPSGTQTVKPCIDDLITNVANMAAVSTAKENA